MALDTYVELRKKALKSIFNSHCEVLRTLPIPDVFGTTTEVEKVVAKHPCRLTLYAEGDKGTDPLIGEQTITRSLWRIYLPVTAQIDPTDTIKINNITYTVLETTDGRQDAAILCVFARRDR